MVDLMVLDGTLYGARFLNVDGVGNYTGYIYGDSSGTRDGTLIATSPVKEIYDITALLGKEQHVVARTKDNLYLIHTEMHNAWN